jgi:hypothetical protein
MKIVSREATVDLVELGRMAEKRFGDLVKAVVDIKRARMAVDAELHADQEAALRGRIREIVAELVGR